MASLSPGKQRLFAHPSRRPHVPNARATRGARRPTRSGSSAGSSIWVPPGAPAIFERTDQGVDFRTTPGGMIIAPYPGVVTLARPNPGGFGTNYPLIRFTAGPFAGQTWYIGHIFATARGAVAQGGEIGHTGTGSESWMGNAKGIPGHAEIGRLLPGGGYPSMSAGAGIKDLVLGGRTRFTGPSQTFGRGRPAAPGAAPAPSTGADSSAAIEGIFSTYLGEGDTLNTGVSTALASGATSPVDFIVSGNLGQSGAPDPLGSLFGVFPNPLDLFNTTKDAINSVGDFLKFIAWIFHPKNILRIVEFTVGITIMAFGIHHLIFQRRGRESGAGSLRRQIIQASPVGEPLRVMRGARSGRRAVRNERRREEFNTARKKARTKEIAKQKQTRTEKNTRSKYGDDPPF